MPPVRNSSKKRDAILEKIRSTDTHPSAEWVYHQLKPDYPDLSLGTVYRNISLFRRDGDIISVGTVSGQERFDAVTDPHPHFICSSCGAVIDIHAGAADEDLYRQIEERYGCSVQTHDLTFRGTCKNCLKAPNDKGPGQK